MLKLALAALLVLTLASGACAQVSQGSVANAARYCWSISPVNVTQPIVVTLSVTLDPNGNAVEVSVLDYSPIARLAEVSPTLRHRPSSAADPMPRAATRRST